MQRSAIVTCSPVLATTSSSRGSGCGCSSLASAISRLVSPAIAEGTTTRAYPAAEPGRVGLRLQLPGERDQPIGLAGHRRGYDHQVVPRGLPLHHPTRDVADALDGADRGAAEFLDDQTHSRGTMSMKGRNSSAFQLDACV